MVPASEADFILTMRALLQRVKTGRVSVDSRIIAQIDSGLVIFLGISQFDQAVQVSQLVDKVANLRIFEDEAGKMNLSLLDVAGEAIVVSQFTLYADSRKGRRPSFTAAADPVQAQELVDRFVNLLAARGIRTQSGQFGAHMLVEIANDGPVTIWLETD
jgi:D-aminoacyl-tRNA deacylase